MYDQTRHSVTQQLMVCLESEVVISELSCPELEVLVACEDVNVARQAPNTQGHVSRSQEKK